MKQLLQLSNIHNTLTFLKKFFLFFPLIFFPSDLLFPPHPFHPSSNCLCLRLCTTLSAHASCSRRRPSLLLPAAVRWPPLPQPCAPRLRPPPPRCQLMPLPEVKHGKQREEPRGAFFWLPLRGMAPQWDLQSFSRGAILVLVFGRALPNRALILPCCLLK